VKSVLVTGGTGLIGSNICIQLIERGIEAHTLARDPGSADAQRLRGLGVKMLQGDVADLTSVERAVQGAEGVIHSAAMLGRPGATIIEGLSSNVLGSIHVLTAAARAGGIPVVQLLTSTFFDMWESSLTEFSPLDLLFRNMDPYSLTKRLAFVEGAARARAGQDVRFMTPGAAFGPSPCVERAMIRPSFNDRIASAIRGELSEQIPLPVPFASVRDCAYVCIAALERGARGERYIAMGRAQDVGTISDTCNRACRIAGVEHRVRDVPKSMLDDPEVVQKYGATMTTLGKRTYPDPFFDTSFTERRLGYVPTPLDEGLGLTIEWMRGQKIIA
jgi:nucleoside-diphosphate-sugar epimerase